MLATATATLPSGEGWAYEFKWDGVRALIEAGASGVRIRSRAGNDVSAAYPELIGQAAGLDDALLDGEIVVFVGGRPSFEALQARMHVRVAADATRLAREAPVTFVLFDVLRLFGVELTDRPYLERRATLERFAEDHPVWTLSPSFDDGPATLEVAKSHGLEGVVAKRLTSRYRPGQRSEDWRKMRFTRAGDFVVIGWEAAAAHPATLSSLALAVTTDDGPVFAGKVGSGLSGRTSAQLKKMLSTRDTPCVDEVPPATGGRVLHWVEPEVVVEVEFVAWTGDRRLRHPVFRGIRTDKTVEQARGDG